VGEYKTAESEAQMARAMGTVNAIDHASNHKPPSKVPSFFWRPYDKDTQKKMRGNKGMHFRLRKLNRMMRANPGLAITSYEFGLYGGD